MISMEYIKENKNYYEEKINELNDKVKYYQNKTQRQDKEIERLNNIIDELEKSICDLEYECRFDNAMWGIVVVIHNKLKELKNEDIELDILKALNEDLDDDVEMG